MLDRQVLVSVFECFKNLSYSNARNADSGHDFGYHPLKLLTADFVL